jgi:predicted ATPase
MNRLFGRATELAQLNRVFQEVREGKTGRGRLVSLAGATGIGKSTLAQACLENITTSDPRALTLSARCVQGRTPHRPYGPFTDMLAQMRLMSGDPTLPGMLQKEAPGWQPDAAQTAGRNALFDQFLAL